MSRSWLRRVVAGFRRRAGAVFKSRDEFDLTDGDIAPARRRTAVTSRRSHDRLIGRPPRDGRATDGHAHRGTGRGPSNPRYPILADQSVKSVPWQCYHLARADAAGADLSAGAHGLLALGGREGVAGVAHRAT